MLPHQQRVVDEKGDLDEKIEKLSRFIDGETFLTLDMAERTRLETQRIAMRTYSAILQERIDAF